MAVDASKVARTKQLLNQFRPWIDRYRGGLPAGWMAAIMLHESDGNFAAPGDVSLGEVGFYQVAEYVEKMFGLPAGARKDPETNIALASLEYMLESINWYLRYPKLVRLGTADAYKLARLTFAIGRSGGFQLADAAAKLSYLQPGAVYDGLRRYVTATTPPQLGSQSPDKVRSRVLSIDDQWAIGQAVDASWPGPPTLIPAPPAGPYAIPVAARPFFVEPIPAIVWVLGGGLAALFVFWAARRSTS